MIKEKKIKAKEKNIKKKDEKEEKTFVVQTCGNNNSWPRILKNKKKKLKTNYNFFREKKTIFLNPL